MKNNEERLKGESRPRDARRDDSSEEGQPESELEQLRQEVADLRAALDAVASGAVDTVLAATQSSHVLLREAQSDLRQSAKLFRAVFDGALDAMALTGDDDRFVDVNKACCALFGRTRNELIGKRADDFASPMHLTRELRVPEQLADELVLRRADGEERALEGTAATNIVPHIHLVVLRDVTARRKMLQDLAESEARFRALVETSTDGIILEGADGRVRYVSPAVCVILGGTIDDYLGRPAAELVYADDVPLAAAQHARLRETPGATIRLSLRMAHRDGAPRFVAIIAKNLLEEPAVASLVTSIRDITQRVLEREARARLAAMVESSDDAIIGKDLEGRITDWNCAAERIYGYSAAEAIGMPADKLLSGERIGERELAARVRQGERIPHHETVRVRKDGTQVEVSVALSPIYNSDGKLIGTSSIARDLSDRRRAETELKKVEEQLRQAQKMEAIGALAGGVAHDFNNILSIIMSYGEMIAENLSDSDPLRGDVDEIQEAAKRAARLTQQLLAFSRKQVLEPRVVDVNRLVLELEKMCRRVVGEDIDLAVLPAESVGAVLVDPSQLEQVVLNLIVNARDAMPRGGKLTIETSDVEIDAAYARSHVGVVPGHYTMLAVTDTGVGMSPETKAHIFEPFFTTKEQGKGTGLGLSTVLGIVQQSGGHVWVYSEQGVGTTFKVYLPHTDRVARQDTPSSARTAAGDVSRHETILLVEDDDQLRNLFRSLLTRAGYVVVDARNAGEAIVLQERMGGPIELLLTDLVMPGMSGRELAERLSPLRPSMKVLYMSGYTNDAIVRHGLVEAEVAFLQKPLRRDVLLRKVREVLDRPQPLAPAQRAP